MVGFSESSENVLKTRGTTTSVVVRTGMLRRMPTAAEAVADRAVVAAAPHLSVLAEQVLHSGEYDVRIPV